MIHSVTTTASSGTTSPMSHGSTMGNKQQSFPIPQPRSSPTGPSLPPPPVPMVPPPLTPLTDLVTALMTRFSTLVGKPLPEGTTSLEDAAGRILGELPQDGVLRAATFWIYRAMKTHRCEKDRGQIGLLMSCLLQQPQEGKTNSPPHHAKFPSEGLRKAAQDAFYLCAVEKNYETVSKIWRYCAQIVASDVSQTVLNQNCLNDWFELLLSLPEIPLEIQQQFLVDVLLYNEEPNSNVVASTESCGFARFRPLQILCRRNSNYLERSGWEYQFLTQPNINGKRVVDMVSDPELHCFCHLLSDKKQLPATTTSNDLLFDALCNHKQLKSPLFPSKVLSGILHAELVSPADYLTKALSALMGVLDGVERDTREICLLGEQFFIIHGMSNKVTSSFVQGSRVARLLKQAGVTQESLLRAHRYFDHLDRGRAEICLGHLTQHHWQNVKPAIVASHQK